MRTHLKLSGVLLGACSALLAFTFTANTQEYYEVDYYDRSYTPRQSCSWGSSSCCYRNVVRGSRSVRYVRVYRDRRYYRSRRDDCGDRCYRTRYYSTRYYTRPYRDDDYYRGRSYRRTRYTEYREYRRRSCSAVRVRVDDRRGGWVWGWRWACD